ncbi:MULTISPECIES: toprim domain-containing protein [unclassified Pseudomonas]|uniref:toprim domain-containing protein n=1 Tax=unclassified Pseudomonas TaxID=196821 RepID=UPI00244C5470|nr:MULTISPECIES: toprim domain-containing protein [unclassified Pseudomonas]MDG9926543.1 toprim domain-containing protein [Pseudomonas sp. GD04042]MDH0481373.1 toprim domain-containing protein [Pseudomonas sp. GD04015]MDH0603322.1 toprim domain-containing protein [Pseudomonas sp. GD03869]
MTNFPPRHLAGTGSACLEKAELVFRDELQSVFGRLDWLPVADGSIHRFHVPGDRTGTENGWYVLFADGIASGCFGSWKAGTSHTWSSREPANPVEAEQMRQRIEQARRQREAEQHQRQQQAARYAAWRWENARRADPDHPYLVAKLIRPYGLRQHDDELLVPLYSAGLLVNLQRIALDGTKRFLSGGQVKGCYSPLGSLGNGPLYICEGWATGATLHQHSGCAVACAMNAGNLKPVALALRASYPAAEIVIAGDDDRQTEGNPGRTAATAAALAVSGLVTFPDWPADAPPELTDFNDLANWRAAHE